MKNCENSNRKQVDYTFVGFIALSFVIMGSLCFNDSLSMDEIFSAFIIKKSYIDMIIRTAHDVHPPLYYILLKFFTSILGYKIYIMNLVSILGTMCTLVLGCTKIRQRFGNKTAFVFILLIMVMPNMLRYHIIVRMYSWAMFFVTASAVYAYEIILEHEIKNWIYFVFYSLCGAYTHYYAIIPIGFIYVLLLMYFIAKKRKNIKIWLLSIDITCLLYFPWGIIFLRQVMSVKEDYWISEITLRNIWEYAIYFFDTGNNVFSIILFLIMISSSLIFMKKITQEGKEKEDYFVLSCLLVFVGTIALGIIVSLAMKPVFISRYMIPSSGLLWLFFGKAIKSLNSKTFVIVVIFMLLIGVNSYVMVFNEEYKYNTETEATKDYFFKRVEEDDVFIHSNEHSWWYFSYYFPGNTQLMDHQWSGDTENTDRTIWLITSKKSDAFIYSQHRERIEENYTMEYRNSARVDRLVYNIYKLIIKKQVNRSFR